MKPNFRNIDISAGFHPQNGMEWQKANGITANWKTPEQIQVKPVYTKEDLEGMEHLNYAAGIPPYLHGPYSMMYAFRPWTIRGLSANMPDSLPQKNQTPSTGAIWHRDKKAFPLLSTSPHTVVMTPTIRA